MRLPCPHPSIPAALTCAVLMASCTIVDTGGAVDNVGREVPVCSGKSEGFRKKLQACRVYTTADGKRYAKLRVRYLPARADWFRCYMVGGCPVWDVDNFYSPLIYRGETDIWYAELADTMPISATRLIPESELDLRHAASDICYLSTNAQQSIIRAHLTDRQNGWNTAVQPIRWVAEVADVPLSIVATPFNWLVMLTGYNLWKL